MRRATTSGRSAVIPTQPRLLVVSGPAAGREVLLDADELVIGRGDDCALSIPDTSMSRKHALVRPVPGGWALSDLESGNGSLVNGVEVRDERLLKHGDVIHLGDSELRFVAGAEGAKPSAPEARRPVRTSRMERNSGEAKARRKRNMWIVLGTLATISVLLTGWKMVDHQRQTQVMLAELAQQAHVAEMAELLKEAKNSVRQGDWAAAKLKLSVLAAEDPDFEARQVESYLQTVEREIPNQRLLDLASQALSAGELGRAAEALGQVENTVQEEALSSAKAALDEKIKESLARARALLVMTGSFERMEELKALCDEILKVRSDRDAEEMKRQAETAIAKLKNPAAVAMAPATPWISAQQAYREGDVAAALSKAEACAPKFVQCSSLSDGIHTVEAKLRHLDGMSDAELGALFELDKKLAGGSSSETSKPLRTLLASRLFLKASQAKSSGEWPKAIDLSKRVLRVESTHPGALSIVSEGQRQAHEMYIRGYQLQRNLDVDEAAKLYRDVLKMTPSDDESHQKAKARLEEIERR